MVALRYFLVESERSKFSLYDVTLCHWPTIDAMGKSWEEAKAANVDLPEPTWSPVLPFMDVWLHADKSEAHFIQKLIPTLDWDGGLLGVRLRLEPKDATQFQIDYLTAREEARRIEETDANEVRSKGAGKAENIVLWPRSLAEFLQRRLTTFFTLKSYILNPAKFTDPDHGDAKPQALLEDALPIDGEPFKGLIRIDEISAQRGFGQAADARDPDDRRLAAGSTATRRMSEQLRSYWNRHLDPFENPDPKDIEALRAIEQAQRAFDERLRAGFSAALEEVEGLGYPGVTDPRLKISTRLKPVDGLNHDAAVQYMIPVGDRESAVELNLPEDSNGLGYQNLISMIFRLMSFRDAWMRVGKAALRTEGALDTLIPRLHLVLIEEPEAHLHTQVQQVFIRQAYNVLRKHKELEGSALKTQLIVSTHSSHIAHECDFDQLHYFRRLPPSEKMVPTSCVVDLGEVFGSDLDTKRFATRYVKVTHCDLFFADAAVLVEGPAERILVPFFVRHHPELAALQESYITWLEIGGSHGHRLRGLIEQLGLTTLIITDLDAKDAANKSVPPARGASLKSRNQTLTSWCPGKDDLDALIDLKPEEKCRWYERQRFSIRVAYQSPVDVDLKGKKSEALCNTLEDALVIQNLNFFSGTNGTGLWAKFKAAIESSKGVAELSQKLFEVLRDGGKAEFALSLLEIGDPRALHPPQYILEGLMWLAVHALKERQRDLGIAAVESSSEAPAKLVS